MQFKRLKKNYKKQIMIGGLILVCVISAITITTTRAKYKLTEDIPLVRGTINYKMPDLRIVAVSISEDETNYIETDTIPTSGYQLNTTKSICTLATTDALDEEITIEYKEGKVNILGVTKKGTRCYLYFDLKNVKVVTTSIGNLEINMYKPDFSKVATRDEGIFETQDELYGGVSYYWRGNVKNNWVKFGKWPNDTPDVYYGYHVNTDDAYIEFNSLTSCQNYESWNRNCTLNSRAGKDMYWRIVRINGNGTIRLIYSGTSPEDKGASTSIFRKSFNPSNGSEYTGYQYTSGQSLGNSVDSYIKIALDEWYNTYLNKNGIKDYIVTNAYFCNDRSLYEGTGIGSDKTTKYSAYNRLIINKSPILKCFNNEDLYQLPIGLITADEIAMAGGTNDTLNLDYYLNSDVKYWTMTPVDYAVFPSVMFLNKDGIIMRGDSVANSKAVRPVINLKAETEFQVGGNGTIDNPYVVV